MPRMPRSPSESPERDLIAERDHLGSMRLMACDLIADGQEVYRGIYAEELWSVEQNAPEQWNLWRCHRLDNEVVDGLWRGDVDWELWWWGEWLDSPMQMDRRYVSRPLPRKNLLAELVLTECSDEESWRGRMQRDLKDSTLVCRGTGRYGHQTWFATQYKPDTWNLWDCTGDEPVESGLWRCTTDWRMWWWGEWNEVGVEEPVEVEMARTNLTTSQS
jgi:hypothetical protein